MTGAVGAGALTGCGGNGGGGSTATAGNEVIVVGAGVAGMSAGIALKNAKIPFRILEGRDRPGGRVFSDNSFPNPFDYGAQLFQQAVPIGDDPMVTRNPLFNMAVKQHTPIALAFQQSVLLSGGAPLGADDLVAFATVAQLVDQSVNNAGQGAAMSGMGDISVADASGAYAGLPFYDYVRMSIEADRGHAAADISCEDLWQYSRWTSGTFGQANTDNWFIKTGMGNYVAQFAAGLPIEFNTTVNAIDYSGSGVRVQTNSGTIDARAVIVTASMGVLKSGQIAFTPGLPTEYGEAFNNLSMGSVCKVGFEFDADVFGGLPANASVSDIPAAGSNEFFAMFPKFFGANMCYIISGGPVVHDLEPGGEAALIQYARESLAKLLGPDVLPHITRTACHSWMNDPFARGAYTTATPGHASARRTLQAPVADRVFFAGEGVALEGGASMGGAWITGAQAVEDIRAVRGRAASR